MNESQPHRILIFRNPIAGRGRGQAAADALARHLARAGYEVQIADDRAAASPPVAEYGALSAVVVIGGDGTLREVAAWGTKGSLSDPTRQPPSLIVVPMGTANLMGQHLGLNWPRGEEGPAVVEALRQRRIVKLDVARANGEVFLLIAGIGIDAAIVQELEHLRRGPINKASYLLPTALALSSYKYPAVEVRVDGRRVFEPQPGLVFVGNIAEYGTGFSVVPQARPDDGLLDVVAVPCSSPAALASLFMRAAVGEHTRAEGCVQARGKRIEVDSEHEVPVQLDGEFAGHTPLAIDILPVQIPFIVAAKARERR